MRRASREQPEERGCGGEVAPVLMSAHLCSKPGYPTLADYGWRLCDEACVLASDGGSPPSPTKRSPAKLSPRVSERLSLDGEAAAAGDVEARRPTLRHARLSSSRAASPARRDRAAADDPWARVANHAAAAR